MPRMKVVPAGTIWFFYNDTTFPDVRHCPSGLRGFESLSKPQPARKVGNPGPSPGQHLVASDHDLSPIAHDLHPKPRFTASHSRSSNMPGFTCICPADLWEIRTPVRMRRCIGAQQHDQQVPSDRHRELQNITSHDKSCWPCFLSTAAAEKTSRGLSLFTSENTDLYTHTGSTFRFRSQFTKPVDAGSRPSLVDVRRDAIRVGFLQLSFSMKHLTVYRSCHSRGSLGSLRQRLPASVPYSSTAFDARPSSSQDCRLLPEPSRTR